MSIYNIKMKSSELNSLLSVATHDIKSPLASIKAIIMLINNELKTTKNVEKISEHLLKLNSNATLLNNAFDDFTDLIQIKERKVNLKLSLINLEILIRETINKIKKEDNSAKYILINKANHDLVGNKEKLTKAVYTFITHMQQAAPINSSINVTTERKKNFIALKIQIAKNTINKGIQSLLIAAKKIDYIYSSEIIKLHGGTIKYQKASSSTFLIISLPLKPPKTYSFSV